jgi:hypothetical protein
MDKKNMVHYYLRVNGKEVIDFSNTSFKDMDDYLRLNLFTGMFSNQEELILALKQVRLIASNKEIYNIDIVRRRGNKYYINKICLSFL